MKHLSLNTNAEQPGNVLSYIEDLHRDMPAMTDALRNIRSGVGLGPKAYFGGDTDMSDSDFYRGGLGVEQVIAMAKEGWAAGLEKVAAVDGRIDMPGMAVDFAFDVAGDMLDVGMHMSGEPECWLTEHEVMDVRNRRSKVVRLVVNISASAGISGDTLIARGMRLMGVIDAMEEAGVRVELVVANLTKAHNGTGWAHLIKIKDADQHLDRALVLYWMAHPSALRTWMFVMFDMSAAHHDMEPPSGLGQPAGRDFEPVQRLLDAWYAQEDVQGAHVLYAGIHLDNKEFQKDPKGEALRLAMELCQS